MWWERESAMRARMHTPGLPGAQASRRRVAASPAIERIEEAVLPLTAHCKATHTYQTEAGEWSENEQTPTRSAFSSLIFNPPVCVCKLRQGFYLRLHAHFPLWVTPGRATRDKIVWCAMDKRSRRARRR